MLYQYSACTSVSYCLAHHPFASWCDDDVVVVALAFPPGTSSFDDEESIDPPEDVAAVRSSLHRSSASATRSFSIPRHVICAFIRRS